MLIIAGLAITSAITWLTFLGLSRTPLQHKLVCIIVAAFMPSALFVIILIVGHIRWSQSGVPSSESYSPLVFLIVGFPYFAANFLVNLTTAIWISRRK